MEHRHRQRPYQEQPTHDPHVAEPHARQRHRPGQRHRLDHGQHLEVSKTEGIRAGRWRTFRAKSRIQAPEGHHPDAQHP